MLVPTSVELQAHLIYLMLEGGDDRPLIEGIQMGWDHLHLFYPVNVHFLRVLRVLYVLWALIHFVRNIRKLSGISVFLV